VFYGSWGRGGGTGNIGKSPYSSAYKTVDGLLPLMNLLNTIQVSQTQLVLVLKPNASGDYIAGSRDGFIRRSSTLHN
jgi:hypothetical protein